MAKWAVLFAAAVALAKPGMAQAASPDGDHLFIGTVEVKKTLPSWTSCTLTAIVNVSSGVPRLKSVVLAGSSVCTSMAFTGLPGVLSLDFSAYPPVVIAPNVDMNVAFPPASCLGDLKFIWGGNSANPRTVTFQNLLSDIPGTPPCKIQGTVTQTSGSLNLP
jgi:hypothetical protein